MVVALFILVFCFALGAAIYGYIGFQGREAASAWYRMLMASSFMMPLLLLLLSLILLQIPAINRGSEKNPVTEMAFNVQIYGGIFALSWFGLIYSALVALFLGLAWQAPVKSRAQKILLACYSIAFVCFLGLIGYWHLTGKTMTVS
jgi:hypothetical protein